MYTTLGAPAGAWGGSNGVQSGAESRMSTLIVPLNGLAMKTPRWSGAPRGVAGWAASPLAGESLPVLVPAAEGTGRSAGTFCCQVVLGQAVMRSGGAG